MQQLLMRSLICNVDATDALLQVTDVFYRLPLCGHSLVLVHHNGHRFSIQAPFDCPVISTVRWELWVPIVATE